MLKSLRVALGSSDTRFSAALGSDRRIAVTGAVKGAQPYLTRIGTFDVDLALRGNILLVRRARSPQAPTLRFARKRASRRVCGAGPGCRVHRVAGSVRMPPRLTLAARHARLLEPSLPWCGRDITLRASHEHRRPSVAGRPCSGAAMS